MLPKEITPMEMLYVAASVIRQERWRFNYDRKVPPARIAGYPMPISDSIMRRVRTHIEDGVELETIALERAEDNLDSAVTLERLKDVGKLVEGPALRKRLARCET